ncbi:MAG: TonB-dependent receptor [Bryobacterales bacterium]|nr:TonB-dependent receptor [Bryobacterales bacterium]
MRFLLTLVMVLALLPSDAPAQTAAGTGSVSGVIHDPDGEGLPGAEVVLTNEALGFRREMESTIDGRFDAAGLFPARGYRIKLARKGFTSWESGDIEVSAGRPVIFDITLGQTAEGGAAAGLPVAHMLEGPVTGPSLLIGRQQIEDLPTRGRRLDALVALAPALSYDWRAAGPVFQGFASTSPILIDGVAVENTSSGQSTEAATRVTQDTVENLQVLADGFPAQLGHTIGGLISVATRSGTNARHGSIYGYYGSPDWSSGNVYAQNRNLAGREHQLGATFSGPVIPDRLHFFANVEARDSDSKVLNRITSPLVADASGSSVVASNCKATPAQCAAAIQFIQGQMNALVPRSADSVAGLGKLDFLSGHGSALRLVYRQGRFDRPQGPLTAAVAPNGGALGQAALETGNRYLRANWTAALGENGTNDLSLALFRERLSRSGTPPGLSTGPVSIWLAGVSIGAADPNRASYRKLHRNQIGDHLRATTRSHTIQLGGTWAENVNWIDELADFNGSYQYATLTDFARDLAGDGKNYSLYRQSLGRADRKFRIRDAAVYAQDNWRALRRLTVDAGLRWDKATLPQPTARDAVHWRTGTIPSPNLAFSARVGAAYMLDDNTVARFGFGMFYAPYSGEFIDSLLLGNARQQINILANRTYTGAPAFPAAAASTTSAPAGTKRIVYATSKFWYSYSPQTTFSLERRLGAGAWLAVRYVASPGKRLLTSKDMNFNEETIAARTYSILDANGRPAGSYQTSIYTSRASTNFSHVWEIANGGLSSYNAMVVQVNKDMSHGLSAQGSYTWSHAIGNVNGPWAVPSVPMNMLNGNLKADRGNAGADQRHRAALSWTWRPAVPAGAPPAARALLNNWQQSAIVTLASGLPATPVVHLNGQQFTGTNMLYGTTLNGSDAWGRVPFERVNSLRTQAERIVDVRLARSFHFGERFSASVGAEVFNLFNKQAATRINTVAYAATGGVLTPVSGLGAGIAGAAPRSAQLSFRLIF